MGYRIGIDTGGTFTDFAIMDEDTGRITIDKLPSTPYDPAEAIVDGIGKVLHSLSADPSEINFLIHGTTVATNTLLERKGAKCALITTKGFRDVLQIGRQARPSLYNMKQNHFSSFIPRHFRYEADERTLYTGEIYRPLDEKGILDICEDIRKNNIDAVAVCLMHSYANSSHELRIGEIVKSECPGVFVSLSCSILPEFREYERMSTVGINAYVMPKVSKYIDNLVTMLYRMKVKSELYIMQSNGGVISSAMARESSARTVLSGPAGGALAGKMICRQTNTDQIITVDMGGTSLDICLINAGEPAYTTESSIAGYPIKLPMIEINTIGSGGGSLAWIDNGGALRVGPESAGAVPGPVCYGKGGNTPTVTDANIILGRLNPKSLLAGQFDLDIEAAKKTIEEQIAKPLGISLVEAAYGIIKVVNANMIRGIRVVSVEKGYDPREFTLVPFGGAGPLHGCEMAEELGMPEVIVPVNPGVTSALGMLAADVRHDYVKTCMQNANLLDAFEVQKQCEELIKAAITELAKEGFDREHMMFIRSMDMRYPGQAYEISIDIADERIDDRTIYDAVTAFHKEHLRMYGYNKLEQNVELVNIRLAAYGELPKLKVKKEKSARNDTLKPVAVRDVFMRDAYVPTSIYWRDDIRYKDVIVGPAVIEQLDSTTLVFPGQRAEADAFLNIHIYLDSQRTGSEA